MSQEKRKRRIQIELPSVIRHVTAHLQRYPDGGQILKELIQNADDAGASEIKFRLDTRQNSQENLIHPNMSIFQGPSLFAYNNAVFSEKDWDHFGKMEDSSKENEATKVGRFGVGFLSVFHITDLPMIISADTAALLDPHKKYSGSGRMGWDDYLEKFFMHNGHAECFDGIFGITRFTKHYNATLFRFPLRTIESNSELVSTPYSVEKVRGYLYNSFIKEAPIVLLFLKYIEEISLYDNDRLVYKVSINPTHLQSVKQERQYLMQLAARHASSCSLRLFSISFEIEDHRGRHSVNEKYHWLIINTVGSTDSEIIQMAKSQKSLPWVGIAAPLPQSMIISEVSLDKCNVSKVAQCVEKLHRSLKPHLMSLKWCDKVQGHIKGQVFCFLPLPITTNLPVNIHGYFAVGDNRRSIEWPADDNESLNAQWNKALLNKHITPLYSILLACRTQLITYTHTPLPLSSSEGETITDPYAAWPLRSNVNPTEIWNELLSPVINGISCDIPILWTPANNGSWVSLSKAFYLPQNHSFPLPTIAIDVLVQAGFPVVSLPSKVRTTINECSGYQSLINERTITPRLVRQALKHLSHLTFDDKDVVQDLLECILFDIKISDSTDGSSNQQNWKSELNEINLLPLATTKFKTTTFKHKKKLSNDDLVFVVNAQTKCILNFLPNIEEQIVNTSLRSLISSKLEQLAEKEHLQLRKLTASFVACHLLPKSIQSWHGHPFQIHQRIKWSPGKDSHPPLDWIRHLWAWLCKDPSMLTLFIGLPIVPEEINETLITLLPIPKSAYYFEEKNKDDAKLAMILRKIGAVVVVHTPWVFDHKQISNYIIKINVHAILNYICNQNVSIISSLDNDEKKLLRMQIADYYNREALLSNAFVKVIKQLPIFEINIGTDLVQLACVDRKYILPNHKLKFNSHLSYPKNIYNNREQRVVSLLQKLGLVCISDDELFVTVILPFALQQCNSNPDWCNGDELIVWMLEQGSQPLLNTLKKEPFIRTKANMAIRRKASQLYDINDEQFEKLFDASTDPVFPSDVYKQKEVIPKLLSIGLITWKGLIRENQHQLASLMKERAESVQSLSKDVAKQRSTYILELTGSNRQFVNLIMEQLQKVTFISSQTSSPKNYPAFFQWAGREKVDVYEAPCNLFHSNVNPYLAGGVVPIIAEYYILSNDIQHYFRPLKPADVLQQLQMLTEYVRTPLTNATEVDKVTAMIHCIYKYLNNNCNYINPTQLPESWVWWSNEQGQKIFMPLSKFVWSSEVSLSPLRYTVTSDPHIACYSALFERAGICKSLELSEVASILKTISSMFPQKELSDNFVQMSLKVIKYLEEKNYNASGDVYLLTVGNQLFPASECTYDDRQWCRKRIHTHVVSKLKFIHNDISPKTAHYFGVEPLSKRVAPSEKLKLKYTTSGSKEKVTKVISSIVNKYSENVDVFKELLQNADDAEASEVKFLIDWREHERANLFEQSMKYWQGPAILAYNNATFTDEDLANICNIAAEMKLHDHSQIGRLGLGFCATYCLTDVPSFITRHYLTIFDPHAKYLGNRVSTEEPGMRINLVKDPEALVIFEDQLAPFNEVFGCNVFQLQGSGFHGTLFRFPLRRSDCPKSSICNKKYDRRCVEQLIEELIEEAANLILFLKNVKSLQVFVLESNATDPSEMKLHFEVQKQLENGTARKIMIHDPHSNRATTCSLLSINVTDNIKTYNLTARYVMASSVCSITSDIAKPVGLVPLAEVAIQLLNDTSVPDPLVDGQLFYFLSLPIKIDVPFHVNGFFDVNKDRKSLVKEAQNCSWNELLLRDALPLALEAALSIICKHIRSTMMKVNEKQNCLEKYYSLWPKDSSSSRFTFSSNKNWVSEVFIRAAAKTLTSSKEEILWSNVNGGNWISPKNACILDFIDSVPDGIKQEAVDILLAKGYNIVECPQHVYNLLLVEFKSQLQQSGAIHLITYKQFLENIFLPNINDMTDWHRNNQLLFAITKFHEEQNRSSPFSSSKQYSWVIEILQNHSCIPVAVTGQLVKPTDLIDTRCEPIASLYDPEEGRFPDFAFTGALGALVSLGMITSELPEDELRKKVSSISSIKDEMKYNEKLTALLQYVQYIGSQSRYFPFISGEKQNKTTSVLRNVSFLRPFSKPTNVDIPWFSNDSKFLTPLELTSRKYSALVFTQKPLFHVPVAEDKLDQDKLIMYLGINNNQPKVEVVLNHLCCLIMHLKDQTLDGNTLKYLQDENVFSSIYQFLHQQTDKSSIKGILMDKQCIWQSERLHYTTQVIINWEEISCLPYLCPLSSENKKFLELFETIGVLREASLEFLVNILESIHKDYFEAPISEKLFEFVNIITFKISLLPEFKTSNVDVLLPDENKILRRASTLSCERNSELPLFKEFKNKGGHFIHHSFPQDRSIYLGACFLTDIVLKDIEDVSFLDKTFFHQSLDLIDQLNKILRFFPADKCLFREIIQSLDVAEATEIVFVLDHKTNYSQQSLLCSNSNWKSLQSKPALCIISNCSFNDKSISDIFKLNIKEKNHNFGQFGVGFNVVYHITDCPSFVSFDSDENPVDFCVFDPLQKYCNKGGRSKPGQRWKVNKSHMEQFPDQFQPFLVDHCNLLKDKSKGFVVFRFPLIRFQPQVTHYRNLFQKKEKWLSEGKYHGAEDFENLGNLLKESCNNALLFLDNIKEISVSEARENDFLHKLTSTLKVDTVNGTVAQCEVTIKTEGTESTSQWIVSKKRGFEEVFDIYSNTKEESVAFGGVAAQLNTTTPIEGYWFSCLSTSVCSYLPVHLNAHILLDGSHENLGKLPDLVKWNSIIAKHFLVPAYIELLLKARDIVTGCKSDWFYNLFPKEENDLHIKQLLFEQLLRENYPLLLLDAQNVDKDEIMWLTPQNAQHFVNPDQAIAKKLKKILISLKMPITSAPVEIFESFAQVSKDYKTAALVTPHKVLQWLKSTNLGDNSIEREENSSGKTSNPVKENTELLLEFCLQNSPSSSVYNELQGVPLLLTLAGTLSLTGKLFRSSYAELLPHRHEHFIDPVLEKTQIAKKLVEGNVIIDLTLTEVANNIKLDDVNKPVKLPDSDRVLVKLLWDYLKFYEKEANDIVQFLSKKPIIPTSDGEFYPPSLRNHLFRVTENQVHVQTALIKLGYKKVDFGQLDQLVTPTYVHSLVSEASFDIIKRFTACPPPQLNANADDIYFDSHEVNQLIDVFGQIDRISSDMSIIIKQLPVFRTIDDPESYIRLSNVTNFVIKPVRVPSIGISSIQAAANKIILSVPEHQIESFYRKIISKQLYTDAQDSEISKFYLSLVIPHLSHLNDDELLIHLDFIRGDISLLQKSGSLLSKWTDVMEKLKSIPLVPVENQRHIVSSLYDPEINFHSTFQKKKLPPETWCTIEMLSFLRQLGLQSNISTKLWLDKAKEVINEDVKPEIKPSQKLIDLSTVLMSSFEQIVTTANSKLVAKEMSELDQEFLQFLSEVSEIPFLYCPSQSNLIQHIVNVVGTAPVKQKYFIPFHGSLLHKYSDLSCLKCPILPQECDFLSKLKPIFSKTLHINEAFNTTVVVENLNYLSKALMSVNVFIISSEEMTSSIKRIRRVVEKHYDYLMKHLEERVILQLVNVQCIFLATPNNTSYQFVKPNQLVMHVPHEQDFRPFCYETPQELSKYTKFLEIVGVQESLTPLHYIRILSNIRSELNNGTKTLLEDKIYLGVCESAYTALISSLRSLQDPPLIPVDLKIYLPSESMYLMESTELVYNNVPWIAAKLHDLPSLGYSFLKLPPYDDEGQRHPPASLRVKFLSELVAERFHEDALTKFNKCIDQELYDTKHSYTNCQVVQAMQETIKSREFLKGIGRLYWHKNQKHPKTNQQFFSQLKKLIDPVIYCVNEIKTVVYFNGKRVPQTVDTSHFCYIDNNNDDRLQLYITHRVSHFSEDKFFEQLAIEIGKYFGHSTGDTIYIKAILQCYPSQISLALDRHQISPFDLDGINAAVNKENEIGSEVLLSETSSKEDFLIVCSYEEGEIVLYHSLDREGKSSFRIAKVIECPTRVNALLNDKCIVVQVGLKSNGDPLTVETSLLQIFKQLDTSQRKALETGSTSAYVKSLTLASLPDSLQEIEQWVREIFIYNKENACCSLSYLSLRVTAHLYYIQTVAKSKSNEEFLDLVKKIIEILKDENSEEAIIAVNYFVQMKCKMSIKDDDDVSLPTTGRSGNILVNLSPSPNTVDQITQPLPTRKLLSSNESISKNKCKTSIKEAKLWLQQAKCDYLAAIELCEAGNSFKSCKFPALICFLCHDVVEKSMKGLMFLKCGLPDDMINNNHLLSLYKIMDQSSYITSELKGMIKECILQVVEHSNKSRYPNYHIPSCTPASVYLCTDASTALHTAHKMIAELQKDSQLNELIGKLEEIPKEVFSSPTEGIPEFWDEHGHKDEDDENHQIKIVLLKPGSAEFNNVAERFLQTLPECKIYCIDRIQNKPLWEKYITSAKNMMQNNNQLGEKLLFHGTAANDPKLIYMGNSGFDIKYGFSGLWGKGNYFSVNSLYSNGFAYVCENYRQIILANVLTGISYHSEPDESLSKPPLRINEEQECTCHYDSVSGELGGSKVYITYDSNNSYPAYLITYTS